MLDIPCTQNYSNNTQLPNNIYQLLLKGVQHQNIIGWDNFLREFT
jgi:hypothetical protein